MVALGLVLLVPGAAWGQSRTAGGGTSGAAVGTATSGGGLVAPVGGAGLSGTGAAAINDLALGPRLELARCFEAARAASLDLELARTRLALTATDLRRTWSALKPKAQIQGTALLNDEEVEAFGRVVQERWQFDAGGGIVQPLFQGGALSAVRAAEALRDSARVEQRQVRIEVLHGVARAFYGALALQEAVVVARQQVEDTRRHLQATRMRFEAGAVSQLDVLRAEIDHATADEDLTVAQAGLASAKLTLATLVGRPADAGDFELVRPEAPRLETLSADDAVAQALGARPEIAAAEREWAAADHLVTARWMAFLPSLDLGVQGRYTGVTGFFREDHFSWFATLTVTVPLYDGGLRYAEIEAAELRRRQAEIYRESLAIAVKREVLQARLDVETAASNLAKAESTSRLAQKSADLVRARFDAGLATSLDVTDATSTRFSAETDVVRRRLDVELALLSLARAMGMFEEVAQVPAGS